MRVLGVGTLSSPQGLLQDSYQGSDYLNRFVGIIVRNQTSNGQKGTEIRKFFFE